MLDPSAVPERMPRLFGPRDGDPTGLAVCCWRCDAWLTGHGLARLRLDYGIWPGMGAAAASRAELLGVEPPPPRPYAVGGALDPCHYCGAEQDWTSFLDAQPQLLQLARAAGDSGDAEQVALLPWFVQRRFRPMESRGLSIMEHEREGLWLLLDEISTIDDRCKDDDGAFRALVRKIVERRHEYAQSFDGQTLVWKSGDGA